jgi:hypothetical protein
MLALLDPDPDSESGSTDLIESGSETLEKRLWYLTSGRCKVPLAGTPLSGPLPGGSTPPRGTPWRKGAPLMLTGAPRPGITPGRTMPAMRGRLLVIIIRPRRLPKKQNNSTVGYVLYFFEHHQKYYFSETIDPDKKTHEREIPDRQHP